MASLQNQYAGTNIEAFENELDNAFKTSVTDKINDFFTLCYNLDTAIGAGLDRWGEFLEFPRYIKNYVGDEPFYKLDDDQYRKILKLKALQRRGNVNIPELNRYMKYLFDTVQGGAYVKDPKDMTFVTYVFEYEVESWLWFVFNNYDILPHPGGVGTEVVEIILYPFAFDGQAESNFYNVNFFE